MLEPVVLSVAQPATPQAAAVADAPVSKKRRLSVGMMNKPDLRLFDFATGTTDKIARNSHDRQQSAAAAAGTRVRSCRPAPGCAGDR